MDWLGRRSKMSSRMGWLHISSVARSSNRACCLFGICRRRRGCRFSKRRFLPNLHNHRFWVESEKRFVSLKVSSKGMRIIDKRGIENVLEELRARGEKV